MEAREFQDHLKRITYKPGWIFSIDDTWTMRPYLYISFRADDAFNPGREIKVGRCVPMPQWLPDIEYFEAWLFQEIMKMERHEAQEFFKRDGEMLNDPHRKKHDGRAVA